MITGKVDPLRRCLVSREVRGPDGQPETVEFQVDSGFSGFLLLPPETVQRLALPRVDGVVMRLADGNRVEVPRYSARIIWDGSERVVTAPASGQQPLIGTGLLDGHRLNAEITPGGTVTIEPL